MNHKIFLVLLCLIFVAGCGSPASDTMPPEMAKNMLKLKGYDFTEKSYFQAIENNDVQILRAFYDAQMNPNARSERGETPLTFAIAANAEIKTVKFLADNTNINEQDKLGQSPLHLALSQNKEDVFDYLLDKGADVNVGGAKGTLKNQTALYLAVTRGRDDLVQKLLDKGANPNIRDSEGGVVLSEACIGAPVNPDIVKMLLDKNADANQAEKNGATPLIYIAANKQAAAGKRQAIVKMLLDKGANKKAKDRDGKTALDWAKANGNADILEMLK